MYFILNLYNIFHFFIPKYHRMDLFPFIFPIFAFIGLLAFIWILFLLSFTIIFRILILFFYYCCDFSHYRSYHQNIFNFQFMINYNLFWHIFYSVSYLIYGKYLLHSKEDFKDAFYCSYVYYFQTLDYHLHQFI
jgi:hypothetical protein